VTGNSFAKAGNVAPQELAQESEPAGARAGHVHRATFAYIAGAVSFALILGVALFLPFRHPASVGSRQRTLTRLTLDPGLQIGATWSPDGGFIAYASNRGGKFDVWVQKLSGGNPVQVTKGEGQNWQPDWSTDGKYIAYRSERNGGGIYVIPALGGEGQERRVSSFGYYPRWSPDSSQILFQSTDLVGITLNRFYVAQVPAGEPREVLNDLFNRADIAALAADWYPDGKRISLWTADYTGSHNVFWTVPLNGGSAVSTEIPTEIQRALSPRGRDDYPQWFRFRWAPSGRAIYFELSLEGARNLWRMDIDPKTFRAIGIERLTVGPGTQTELSISADGRRMAFTGANQEIRGWLFPFDALHGRVTGSGEAITSPGIESWQLSLAADGSKVAIGGTQANTLRLWEKALPAGVEIPLGSTDGTVDSTPIWSADGTRLLYPAVNRSTGKFQIFEWSTVLRTEKALTPPVSDFEVVYDWSRDGNTLLICRGNEQSRKADLWQLTLSKQSDRVVEHRLASSDNYELYQDHYSPNGQWIVFEAVPSKPSEFQSALYVMPAAGGAWTRITDGKHWDDKPRWSPDGKLIYFLSERSGFFDLWAIRFDPVRGRPEGGAFLVKAFDDPSLMIPKMIPGVDIGITRTQLAIPLQQVSGSIWILDNVEP
jgi:Tol biopolymer transport system component